MSKKISVRYDYEDESQVLQEGKKVKTLKKNVEKQQKRYIPTYSEIQAELQITLKERMFPLIDLEYSKQVELKLEIFRGVMRNWFKQARNLLGGNKYLLPPWLQNDDGMPCEIKSFVECDEPNRLKYRNKVELTIGLDKDEVVRVGYNRGNAQKQIHLVEKAESNPMMTDEQLLIAQKLEEYVTQNLATLPYYDKSEYKGFWKYVQIKQSQRTKQISILIVYSDTGIEQGVLDKFRQDMVQLFMQDLKLHDYKIVSLGITAQNNVSDNIDSDAKVEIIAGQDYYEEQILGKTFQVSQNSFLQINTPQCEKLYTLLSQILTDDGQKLNEETIFLDICSGIGTIGMCLAENCKEVIGIEMVQSACENAKKNQEVNKITNYKVICSKVEDCLNEQVKSFSGKGKIIGIVDPPRAGLHKDVIRALRTCKGLDHLIFVACNPAAVIDNLNDLCLPSNKNGRFGPPFDPIFCHVVDLFPQTKHMEGVFYLKRVK